MTVITHPKDHERGGATRGNCGWTSLVNEIRSIKSPDGSTGIAMDGGRGSDAPVAHGGSDRGTRVVAMMG
jgi:hypothetical protein